MKQILCLLLILIVGLRSNSQPKTTEITHYIFPEFNKGVVLMKNGVKNETMLNYNSLTEEMIFESAGKKLALVNLDLIDTVFIKDRKFIILNKKFAELVYKSKYDLYAVHKCSIADPGKPAAYGGTSQTSSTTSYSSFLVGGKAYELKLPEGLETIPSIEYYITIDGKLNKFTSLRQLTKIFEDKEKQIKDFAKTSNVKFENQESIVELIKFIAAS